MSYPVKDILNSFLNICAGVLAALALVFVFYLLITANMIIMDAVTLGILVVSISSFAGGLITSAMAGRNKILLTSISAMVLLLVYNSLFSLNSFRRSELIMIAIILTATMAGGLVNLWVEKMSARRDQSSHAG
jgi:hypothetical protein